MKLWLYLAMLWLLFFSQTYAVTSNDIPIIQQKTQSPLLIGGNTEQQELIKISFKQDERIDKLVQIQQKICLDTLWPWDHKKNWYNYSCLNQTLVRTAENWGWIWDRKSPTNDHWYCQLNYRRHKDFIDSPEFADPVKQLTYCNEVWMDAYKKWVMPWMAYSNKNKMKSRFIITQ